MPENPPPAPSGARTPGGLPFRTPQAHLVPQLRTDAPGPEGGDGEEDGARSPEEVRKIIGAFQSGTRRGRHDAARAPREHVPDTGEEPPR